MPRSTFLPWVLLAVATAACGSRTGLDGAGAAPLDAGVHDATSPDADAAPVAADAVAPDGPPVPDVRGCPLVGQATLSKAEPFPTGIAVDATQVYWATTASTCDSGLIRSFPKAGGVVATLADGQANPRALIVDATSVYWYNGCGTGVLRSAPLGGGPAHDYPTQIAVAEDARVLAADSRNLYFNDYGVLGIPKAGGAQFVIDDTDFVYGLAADDRGVYWLGPIGGGPAMAVFAYPAGATAPTQLVMEEVGEAFAMDTGWLYFYGAGIQRVPRGGGPVETLLAGPVSAGDIAVDGTSLYWAEGYPSGSSYAIHRMPAGGGADTVIAKGDGWVYRLAVDEHCVYWTNPGAGTVETVAK